MHAPTPTYGISSQFEIDLDARLPENPMDFISDASKAGLYTQFFVKDGSLWARVAGPLDIVLDFQTRL